MTAPVLLRSGDRDGSSVPATVPGVATLLDISAEHGRDGSGGASTASPRSFERMLVAQTPFENLTLVTVDEALQAYGVADVVGHVSTEPQTGEVFFPVP